MVIIIHLLMHPMTEPAMCQHTSRSWVGHTATLYPLDFSVTASARIDTCLMKDNDDMTYVTIYYI